MDKLLNTKLFLLDMDGTLYLGDEVFDGAVDFINTVRKSGREYIYLTNNSSRAGIDYITRLRKLGFPCEKENVFTSGMATAMYLNSRHPGALVYPVGTPAFLGELESYGVALGDSEEVSVVCVGFDTTLTYESSIRPCIICGAARHLLPQIPTGSALCRQTRCCQTAAASVRC